MTTTTETGAASADTGLVHTRAFFEARGATPEDMCERAWSVAKPTQPKGDPP
jgi:hypothetical protein